MYMWAAGAVTVMAGDMGAMMVRFAPIGPELVKLHAIGAMKFNVVMLLEVMVMVVEALAISVSVSAMFAVMVMVFAFGILMNTLVEAVVKVNFSTDADSTAVMLAEFVSAITVAFGALMTSICPLELVPLVIATLPWVGHDTL